MDQIGPYCAQVRSARYLDFSNPQPDQFTLDDIVSGLATTNRFNGQTLWPYSVAQHSVLVSLIVPKEHALAALLHDGSEAFMGDIASPLKALLPDYKKIEEKVQGAVHAHFGLPYTLEPHVHAAIKHADLLMCSTERAQLMPADDRPWPGLPRTTLPITIERMDSDAAKALFTNRLESILNDTPFEAHLGLWRKQYAQWLDRTPGIPEWQAPTTTFDMPERTAGRPVARMA